MASDRTPKGLPMRIDDLFSIDGKTALVTGGSRGIGEMIAAGFLANGAKVYISSRKAEACDATAVRLALIGWGTGKTALEISRAELLPGESFQALIEQQGHMHVNALEARLLCREKAVYRQGTDTRTATEDVVDLPLDKVENLRIAGQLTRQFEGRIPENAMHSFKAGHNEIDWRIVVTADIERWPDFKRSFRLRVLAGDGR